MKILGFYNVNSLVVQHASRKCQCFKMTLMFFVCIERSLSHFILSGLSAGFLFPEVELHSSKDEEILKPSPFVNWELPANESHM